MCILVIFYIKLLLFIRATLATEMLAAMDWSCLLLRHGFKELPNCTGNHFQQLVEAQSILFTVILASNSQKLNKRANHR